MNAMKPAVIDVALGQAQNWPRKYEDTDFYLSLANLLS